MSAHRTTRHPARLLAAASCAVVLWLGLATAAAAAADDEAQGPPPRPDDLAGPEELIFAPDPQDFIVRFEPQDFIEHLGSVESEEEHVIVLETDILFRAMQWELPGGAGSYIADLADEVPEGATVDVHGHTDSNPVPDSYGFDNQELSERRAASVAEALAEERPDLELNEDGFGSDEPAVTEDPEDPSTYAANRRVEIRYG